jgi:CRP-like cAMP-binding protein
MVNYTGLANHIHANRMERAYLIHAFLKSYIDLSADEFLRFAQLLENRQVPAKTKLTDLEEVETNMYFVEKGFLLKYFLKGRESVVTHIAKSGHVVSSSVSFLTGKPSEYIIEAIVDTDVWILSKTNLDLIISQDVRYERMARLVALDWLLHKEEWENDYLLMSSKDRFLKFARTHPDLMATIPQKYLASYLNIQPETFSRYKHLLKS